MKNYHELEQLRFSHEPSDSDESGATRNDDDNQQCKRPLGFSRDQISIQVSTPGSPFYATTRTRKSPGRRPCSSYCSSPVIDYYDNYYPRTPGYVSRQAQHSPKLALPFMATHRSFKSFEIQDGENYQLYGYGYPYLLVKPHYKTVITPRRTIRDDNDHQEEEGGGGEECQEGSDDDGLLLERILNMCQCLPANLRAQLLNSESPGELTLSSVKDILKMSSTTSRGLGGPVEDLSLKLDRFKIRTVDIDDDKVVTQGKK